MTLGQWGLLPIGKTVLYVTKENASIWWVRFFFVGNPATTCMALYYLSPAHSIDYIHKLEEVILGFPGSPLSCHIQFISAGNSDCLC